MKGLSATAPGL